MMAERMIIHLLKQRRPKNGQLVGKVRNLRKSAHFGKCLALDEGEGK